MNKEIRRPTKIKEAISGKRLVKRKAIPKLIWFSIDK
jgi:hypothetical protein